MQAISCHRIITLNRTHDTITAENSEVRLLLIYSMWYIMIYTLFYLIILIEIEYRVEKIIFCKNLFINVKKRIFINNAKFSISIL